MRFLRQIGMSEENAFIHFTLALRNIVHKNHNPHMSTGRRHKRYSC